MGRRICLLRSYIKGEHYFPAVIMALQFYLVAYPFLRGYEEIYPYLRLRLRVCNLPVPVHGNGVSLDLYYTGRGGRVNHALQSYFITMTLFIASLQLENYRY